MQTVLAVMASHGYEHIVLGSWGCGAFGNAPSLVARAFADAFCGRFLNVFLSVAFPEIRKAGRAAFGSAFAPFGVEMVSLAAGTAGGAADVEPVKPSMVRRGLSAMYGAGASEYDEETLVEWQDAGILAKDAVRRKDWSAARAHYARCVALRPDWSKGRECLSRAIDKEREAQRAAAAAGASTQAEVVAAAAAPSTGGLPSVPSRPVCPRSHSTCPACGLEVEAVLVQKLTAVPCESCGETFGARWPPLEEVHNAVDDGQEAQPAAAPRAPFKSLVKGIKLLPHEQALVEMQRLRDVTHAGSTAVWLSGESTPLTEQTVHSAVYRPMGDREFAHLFAHGALPATQPYQTIVEGPAGRRYAERYLRGSKRVDSSPTTVVEFVSPRALVARLFAMQCKPEEGCLSHGLGDKGGKGLPLFNESLADGSTTFRIVLVKRVAKNTKT